MCICYYKNSGMPAGVEPLPRASRSSRVPRGMMRRRQDYSSSLMVSAIDLNRGEEENRIFKATMTVLLFFFNLLHWSCFVSLSHGLPHIDALKSDGNGHNVQLNDDGKHAPGMAYGAHHLHLQQVFLAVFTASRFLAIIGTICCSRSVFRPDVAIFASLLFTFMGSALFVISQVSFNIYVTQYGKWGSMHLISFINYTSCLLIHCARIT